MSAATTPVSTTADLFYTLEPEDGVRAYQRVDPSTGEKERNFKVETKSVVIENVRGKEDTVSLDTTGFQFYKHTSKYTTFDNDEEIYRIYYPESAELIKKLTGASRVESYDHSKQIHARACYVLPLRGVTWMERCVISHPSSTSRRAWHCWPPSTSCASSCRSDCRLVHRSTPQTPSRPRCSETPWASFPDYQPLATHRSSCYRLAFGPLWLSKFWSRKGHIPHDSLSCWGHTWNDECQV